MKSNQRTYIKFIEAQFKSKHLPFKQRIDIVFVGLIILIFIFTILLWSAGVQLARYFGAFEKPLIRIVQDERILDNFRNQINQKPILTAVSHTSDLNVYMAQEKGNIFRFDPSTYLWHTLNPFSNRSIINPEIIMLRSGSGIDPLSYHPSSHPPNDIIWGLTRQNGLIKLHNHQWEIVKGDTLFTSLQNQPLTNDDITAASVSVDKQWLLLGTKENAIGLYHIPTHNWVSIPQTIIDQLPSHSITHIQSTNNQFWIGTPKGLSLFAPHFQSPSIISLPKINGSIQSIAVDSMQQLWVLEKRSYSTKNSGCIRLTLIPSQYPKLQPLIIIDETNIYPNLALEDFQFARYFDDRLIIAGNSGIYSYDTKLHNWALHFSQPVSATLPFQTGNGFYFGSSTRIGIIAPGPSAPWNTPQKQAITWKIPGPITGGKITKMAYGPNNEILALGSFGTVTALSPSDLKNPIRTIFNPQPTSLDPTRFQSAAPFGDYVLFFGPNDSKSALLHNVVTRNYTDILLDNQPEWLNNPNIRLISSNNQVFIISPRSPHSRVYRLAEEQAAQAQFKKAQQIASFDGRPLRILDVNPNGIIMLSETQDKITELSRFNSNKEPLISAPPSDMFNTHLIDAAPYRNGVIFAISQGLRYYNYLDHSWGPLHSFSDKSTSREVVQVEDHVFTITQQGQLLELSNTDNLETRIGGPQRFSIPDNLISDALLKEDKIFIAGNGSVDLYHTMLRSVTHHWKLPSNAPVKLIDIVKGQPLTLCGGIATIGNQALDPQAGPVLNISIDTDSIWTVRLKSPENQRYIKRYPIVDPFTLSPSCYFYQPYSGGGPTRVFDAATLPDHNIVLATDQGTRFYSVASRSWYNRSYRDPIPKGSNVGEIFSIGNQILFAAHNDQKFQLTFVDASSVKLTSGCLNDPIAVAGKNRTVLCYTVDPQTQSVAYIDEEKNGAVTQYANNLEIDILLPTRTPPDSRQLKRLFGFNNDQKGYLLTTAPNQLYVYNLQKRTWYNIPLIFEDYIKTSTQTIDNRSNIDIEEKNGIKQIIATTPQGHIYIGNLPGQFSTSSTLNDNISFPSTIQLHPIYTPHTTFNANGNTIQDVLQQTNKDNTRWVFVLQDRIKYFDPKTRTWGTDILIPGINNNFSYRQIKNRAIIVSNDAKTWFVGVNPGPYPSRFARYDVPTPRPNETTAIDENGTIWRYIPQGTLFRIPLPSTGDYVIPQSPTQSPFIIHPPSVRKAFTWNKKILFDTFTGIRLLDTKSRMEIPVPTINNQDLGIKEALQDQEQLWIRTNDDRLLFLQYQPDGSILSRILPQKVTVLETQVQRLKGQALPDSSILDDKWSLLQDNLIRLPNGQYAFDPILQFQIGSKNELFIERNQERTILANYAVTNLQTLPIPPPLDSQWIRWNRSRNTFEIKTPNGIKSIPSSQITNNNALIFEEVNALLPNKQNLWCAANNSGIWYFNNPSLQLTDPTITFLPINSQGISTAAHGAFISSDNRFFDTQGNPLSSSTKYYSVSFGDVALTEDITQSTLTGRIKTTSSNTPIDAFAPQGFSWDQQKKGLAYINSTLMIQTLAGLHPVLGYTPFETLPRDGRIYSRKQNQVFFQQGSSWYYRTSPSQWQLIPFSPLDNKTMIDNSTWKWELKNSQLLVSLKGNPNRFKVLTSNSGIAFNSDIIRDAIAFDNQVFIGSDAFIEILQPSGSLFSYNASRLNPLPIQKMDTFLNSQNNQSLIISTTTGQYYRWNSTSQKLEPIPGNFDSAPTQLLFSFPQKNPRIRMFRDNSGKIRKEMRLTQLNHKDTWVPFQFKDNCFPFDIVTSIASFQNSLYIGTLAGLQIHEGNFDTSLNSSFTWLDMRNDLSTPPLPVLSVGTPPQSPNILIVNSPSLTISKTNSSDFQAYTGPLSITRRLRVQDHLWRLIQTPQFLEIQYKDSSNSYTNSQSTLTNGLFPHDNIKDIAISPSHFLLLWQNGSLSIYPSSNIIIDSKAIHIPSPIIDPLRFIILDHDILSPSFTISKGIYLQSKTQAISFFNPALLPANPWQPITQPPIIAFLQQYAQYPPLIQYPTFRLVATPKTTTSPYPYTFQYLSPIRQWEPIPWIDHRLAIDQWSSFTFHNNLIYAATPSGLVSFSYPAQANISLDPTQFQVIPQPLYQGQPLTVTDIISPNSNNPSSPIILQCQATTPLYFKVFPQQPLTSPTLISDPQKDPIIQQVIQKKYSMVTQKESSFWQWNLHTPQAPQHPFLKAFFKGEEIHLTSGRFPFDGIKNLLIYKDHSIEIVTPSGGWYSISTPHQASSDFHISNYHRPVISNIDSSKVTHIRFHYNEEREKILGLNIPQEGFIHIGKDGITGKTQEFPQYLADDQFWQYMKTQDGNPISITSIRGTPYGIKAERRINNGRFQDDIVTGLPVIESLGKNNYYLVPTQAGILRIDTHFQTKDIYPVEALPFQNNTSSSVVFIDQRTNPQKPQALFLAAGAFHSLENPAIIVSYFSPLISKGKDILAIEEGPQDFIRVRWKYKGSSSSLSIPWTLIDPANPKNNQPQCLYVNLRNSSRFRHLMSERKSGYSSAPWMRVQFIGNQIEFLLYGSSRPYILQIPNFTSLVEAVVHESTLFVIGPAQVWEINLEKVLNSL